MSEEFEKLKNGITDFHQAAENKKEAEKKTWDEKLKKEELILEKMLEKYGVRRLFEEIRDSGLVKWKIKGGIFRSYEPARIEFTRKSYNCHSFTALSLKFNWRGMFPKEENMYYEEVAIAVAGGELCLCKWIGQDDGYSYIPIKEGELATVIAKELALYIRA